uniref:hypothetical protein n=1 Tax=uncultured Flavonifractor sp. TaxID=1193534 RepID=UPI00261F1255|nr:hypothetical protein [uncultured Flavonifractor sp.]
MSGSGMIFSQVELMVLLSALGGDVLYGFWTETPSVQRILQAANSLTYQGIMNVDETGFHLPSGDVKQLLQPVADAIWAVLLTPKDSEQAQVCYMIGMSIATGFEMIAVQQNAARVYSFATNQWENELEARCVLSAKWNKLPNSYRQDRPLEQLGYIPTRRDLEEQPDAEWLLEYIQVPQKKPYCGVLISKTPGNRSAWSSNGVISVVTNDIRSVVSLPKTI